MQYACKVCLLLDKLAHMLHELMAHSFGAWQRAVGTSVVHWQLVRSWQRAATPGIMSSCTYDAKYSVII